MPDARYSIALKSFSFPDTLGDNHANFRFAIDLRYASDKGGFKTANAVIPSPDTYWECDEGRAQDPRYVRAANASGFDMTRISDWDRTALLIVANYIRDVRLTIIDVDRKDW